MLQSGNITHIYNIIQCRLTVIFHMTHIHLWLWDFGSGIDRHGLKNEFIDTHFTKALCVDSWQVSNLVLHKRLQPELLF